VQREGKCRERKERGKVQREGKCRKGKVQREEGEGESAERGKCKERKERGKVQREGKCRERVSAERG
jgi:hypothetical protein